MSEPNTQTPEPDASTPDAQEDVSPGEAEDMRLDDGLDEADPPGASDSTTADAPAPPDASDTTDTTDPFDPPDPPAAPPDAAADAAAEPVDADNADAGEKIAGDIGGAGGGLSERAAKLGLDEADLAALGDGAAKALDLLEGGGANTDTQEQEPSHDAPRSTQDDGYALNLDEEAFDPALIETLRGLKGYYDDKLTALNGQVGQLTQRLADRDQQESRSRVDRLFADLGGEYHALLGTGERDSLAGQEGGPAKRENREKVEDAMETLRAGLQQRGKPVPRERELFERALQSELGGQLKAVARREVDRKVRDRRGQFIARPTSREGASASPTQAAMRAVSAKYRAYQGETADADEPED